MLSSLTNIMNTKPIVKNKSTEKQPCTWNTRKVIQNRESATLCWARLSWPIRPFDMKKETLFVRGSVPCRPTIGIQGLFTFPPTNSRPARYRFVPWSNIVLHVERPYRANNLWRHARGLNGCSGASSMFCTLRTI